MPPRKKKQRRRRKPKISIINTVTSLAVLNGWSNASVGMGLVPFFTEGWFGRAKTSASDNSWEISLHEIVSTITGMDDSEHGFGSSGKGLKLGESLKKNFRENGAQAIMTTILLPAAVTFGSKLARKQINFVNKLGAPVLKPMGVKL